MNQEEQNRKEKELQKVALELSSEDGNNPLAQVRNHHQSFQTPFSQHDDTETRLQNTLNQHRNAILPIGNMQEDGEAFNQNHDENILNQSETEEGQFEGTAEEEQKETENEGVLNLMNGIMPKTLSQRILEFTGIFPKYITDNPILSRLIFSVFPFVIIIFFILIIIVPLGAGKDENGLNEMATYLSYGVVETNEGSKENLMKYLRRGGWCDDTDDCIAYNFFFQFRNKIEKRLQETSGCNSLEPINTLALIGVMFYNRSTDELLSSEVVNNELFNHYLEEMDYLVESMLTSNDESEDDLEDDTFCKSIPLDNFKEEIIRVGGYIDQFREDLGIGLSYEEKATIYEKMIEETNDIGINSGGNIIYTECSGVTVVDQNNNIIGTYSLEDYVAGVIAAEMYEDFPIESKKALAVAARTYVLNSTNYCQRSIESSSYRQNFTSNINATAREAASATAGQILVDSSGKVFSSQYDSWACKGQNTCTYTKLPSGEKHQVTITDEYLGRVAGGHGNGMSQIAAADMAFSGKNYREILDFFYSDGVTISNLTVTSGSASGMIQGTRYTSTAPLHSNATDLINSGFYPNIGHLTGQCVWYAKNRAQEILYYSNMPDDLKQRAINSIKSTLGNGEAWYRSPDGTIFAKSQDVNQPRAGAIVSWSGGLNACSPACGHVAIIESVNADGTVTISEGWKSGSWNSSSWSTVGYQTVTRSIDYIKRHTNNSGDVYTFNGYVYLLG